MTWTTRPRSDLPSGLCAIRAGNGSPCVLIHGVGLNADSWGAQIDAMSKHHAILAPDLPGHGDSPRLEGAVTLDTLTDCIANAVAAFGMPVPVVGHSLGALIAVNLAIRHPSLVSGVAALNAIHRRSPEARDAVRARAASPAAGISGEAYVVTPEQIEAFERDGYVHIPAVLTESEMAEIEEPMMRFLRGEVNPEGKDLCDMSGATDRTPDEYTVYNAMLPRRYLPSMQGNVFERRAASIAAQLQRGKSMTIDYDQLLAKRPNSPDSVFAWHQDSAYWPPLELDPSTCTCWLAIDDSTRANGCMRFLPGSNAEPETRPRAPVKIAGDRMDDESSHALCTTLSSADEANVRLAEIRRGDITVHDQRVVHGSGPNESDGWRRAYVLAFRTSEMVAEERRLGFSHSHNDTFNWDAFHEWQKER